MGPSDLFNLNPHFNKT